MRLEIYRGHRHPPLAGPNRRQASHIVSSHCQLLPIAFHCLWPPLLSCTTFERCASVTVDGDGGDATLGHCRPFHTEGTCSRESDLCKPVRCRVKPNLFP